MKFINVGTTFGIQMLSNINGLANHVNGWYMKRVLRQFAFILGTALATITGWFGGHQKKEKYLERVREKAYAENRMAEQPSEILLDEYEISAFHSS